MSATCKISQLIRLTDEEKFHLGGKPVEIETRGERGNRKETYFLFSDVRKAFGLRTVIEEKGEIEGLKKKKRHYVNWESKNYLTFDGFLEAMRVDKSDGAIEFMQWANNILFVVQMGTKEQKEDLASKLLGTSLVEMKKVMKHATDDHLSCLYVLSLGKSHELKGTHGFPKMSKNRVVFKYGYTGNIPKQAMRIQREYGSFGNNLRILKFAIIDNDKTSKAKSAFRRGIQDITNKLTIKEKKYSEIFSVEEKKLNELKKVLDDVGEEFGSFEAQQLQKKYQGEIAELRKDNEDLKKEKNETEAKLKKKDDELKKKDDELKKKDAELKKKDAELKKKDAELKKKDAELKKKDADNEVLKKTIAQKDAELKKMDKVIKELTKKSEEMKNKMTDIESRIANVEKNLKK